MCYTSALIDAYWVLKDKREVSNTAPISGFIMNILKWFPLTDCVDHLPIVVIPKSVMGSKYLD